VTLEQLSQQAFTALPIAATLSNISPISSGGGMRKFLWLFILLAAAAPQLASGEEEVHFAGGTVTHVKAGAAGALDLSSGTVLRFASANGTLEIPYTAIDSWEHTNEVLRLGVAPAIAVAIVAPRKHSDFIRISYIDDKHATQVVVFEVPKQMLRFLMPALESRAPNCHWLLNR
jgi:hypothetical protein